MYKQVNSLGEGKKWANFVKREVVPYPAAPEVINIMYIFNWNTFHMCINIMKWVSYADSLYNLLYDLLRPQPNK